MQDSTILEVRINYLYNWFFSFFLHMNWYMGYHLKAPLCIVNLQNTDFEILSLFNQVFCRVGKIWLLKWWKCVCGQCWITPPTFLQDMNAFFFRKSFVPGTHTGGMHTFWILNFDYI